MEINPIALLKNDFTDKFGIPRQSLLAENLSYVVFYPEYRKEGILKGIEEFNYLYLIWHFDLNDDDWSPTVRPPRLGGNERRG
ncbi:MAG: SAM-dependent methyltransferase, partial [Clostridia bacterium]|nr:SAM-dependent methyltransferase [Clostridia bacterium]